MYASQILSSLTFTHIERLINVIRITTWTFVAGEGELATSGIYDHGLLLWRMSHEYLHEIVPEACVSIDR